MAFVAVVKKDCPTCQLVEPVLEKLATETQLTIHREDDAEGMFDRGWTDGLPVVPPTPERVAKMLLGTSRSPDDIVAVIPPDLVECTAEKAAVNAVLAGCKPEYLPVVLAAVEAACTQE